ncbi:RraA family protein [Paraglaciecola mesophila]|uniref:Putative 4-hydroxy-4-methyl-2-oxoglutarate aldolase n=2 Tax=Paraglaciecola mesophila TaxID=197222 RepID=K6Z6M6_9ALTE|nr:RraA family protein [Paraglaciecola mesophila]GAC24648.1 conserved domain protein [Paraglaciecola mesophila KMM 241]|tara:strand:+ start:8899 stop:9519 length:621 start_codon:yes stop_codon:yes gene_type:complete
MLTMADFVKVSPCEYSEGLGREQFVDGAIRELWPQMPRIAGPAFTVKCAKGDHLSLHAAIYRAAPGDIIVVEADPEFASAGGNVCAVAQQRGIAGFVIDGVIRDLGEVRDLQFPVYARGVIPVPAKKEQILPFNQPINCGGVRVCAGDIVVADEEGIVVIPKALAEEAYRLGKERTDKDAAMSLSEWRRAHEAKIEATLKALGFQD